MTEPSTARPPVKRPDAPSLAEAAGQVLFRQVKSTLRGKRLLVALAMAGLPPLIAGLLRSDDPINLVRVLVQLVHPFLLPLIAVSLGSGLLFDEAEEGTLTFLLTSPVSRSSVLLGKWAAALALGWSVLLLSVGLTLVVTPVDLGPERDFIRMSVIAVLVGFPAYLGIFTLLGTIFRRGFLAGLIYAFGFELVLSFVPGAAKRLSLRYYMASLTHPFAADETPYEGLLSGFGPDPAANCYAVLVTIAILCGSAALILVNKREFQARNVQG